MVSWAITGATRGIGFGYVHNLSADSENEVFALIRSRATAGPLEELAAQRKNIHIVETDLDNPSKLDEAAAAVANVSGGSLDVLVLNAASSGPETSAFPPSAFRGKQADLEREINENVRSIVINNMFVINAFLELIRNSKEKKIIFISSQSAAIHFTRVTGFSTVMGYSAAKAAMEMITAKYAAELAPEGIKTLSLSPGWVDTDAAKAVTGDPEVRKYVLSAFRKLDPSVNGPIPVHEAVSAMLRVITGLTDADSGKSVTLRGETGGWF